MSRPKGAENKDKEWRAAIRRAVHELRATEGSDRARKIRGLTLLARRLVTKALEGDVAALKEIGDRLDGKATQGVDLGVGVTVTSIERVIVDALPAPEPELIEGKAEVIEDNGEQVS